MGCGPAPRRVGGAAYLDLWWNGRLDTPDHDVMALFSFSFSLPTFGIMVLFSQNIWVVEPFPGVAFKTSDREREVKGVMNSRDGQAQGHCGFRQVIREYWA